MAKSAQNPSIEPAAPPATTAGNLALDPARSVVEVALGRGRTGKTTWARWAIERAEMAGRPVRPADGDRNNGTLVSFYPDATRPQAADDVTVTAWLEELTSGAVDSPGQKIVLDMGGGDRAFATVATHHGFNDVLPRHGVDLVAWYFLTGGRDDYETLVYMEELGFQPPRTVIVLNEGLAPQAAAGEDAFAGALRAKSVRQVLDRGAKVVRMPAVPLKTMVGADNLFIGIHAAAHRGVPKDENGSPIPGKKPLDLWRSEELKRWLGAMEEAHVAAGVVGWLP